ncbi:hypothetical protein L6164_034938 [Bauhinia variegata]|uniref:Uncharacterized protein n=1 Tax=Bauhinia variegata TaxID=167791 RepID=A0ACB9KXB5_BAUVA|nr:hypothetical protein L6164_034938 [Bauhinia variegata]
MDSSAVSSYQTSPHHVVLFPFMSKGHTIPMLHLARFLLRLDLTVTVFANPANRSFTFESIGDTTVFVIESFPFPTTVSLISLPEIKAPINTLHLLYSLNLLYQQNSCNLISNGSWVLFHGYTVAVSREVAGSGILQGVTSDEEPVRVTRFPWIRVCKNEFDQGFIAGQNELVYEFRMKVLSATRRSHVLLVNSFYELETAFVDYLNEHGSWLGVLDHFAWRSQPSFIQNQKPNTHGFDG